MTILFKTVSLASLGLAVFFTGSFILAEEIPKGDLTPFAAVVCFILYFISGVMAHSVPAETPRPSPKSAIEEKSRLAEPMDIFPYTAAILAPAIFFVLRWNDVSPMARLWGTGALAVGLVLWSIFRRRSE